MKATTVEEYLSALPPDVGTVVAALRRVVRRAAPRAQETLLWGSLSWHRPEVGGRVKGAVCLVTVRGESVRLEFIHGARLSDPSGLLQGDQVSKRFVPMLTVADAERPAVARLVEEAANVEWPGGGARR